MNPRVLRNVLRGYIPWSSAFRGTGGTVSARYCYSIWLRHLSIAHEHGLNAQPSTVIELGPGDSIGTGLAALISGAEKYHALDVVEHATSARNVSVFDELVELFGRRENIPGEQEFPGVYPRLGSYRFPSDVLTEPHMRDCLDPRRLKRIRNSLSDSVVENSPVQFICPWDFSPNVIEPEIADMIFSQSVLEYVGDIEAVYRAMARWLKRSGFMSHQIDFTNMQTAEVWNGHWTYSDLVWKLIVGWRPAPINRAPLSTHLDLLQRHGLRVVATKLIKNTGGVTRNRLARRFQQLTDDDLVTCGAHILAVKE